MGVILKSHQTGAMERPNGLSSEYLTRCLIDRSEQVVVDRF